VIKVAVAAPSPALRAGLRALLAADPEVDVVGEAATLSAASRIEPPVDVLVVAGSAADSMVDIPETRGVRISTDSTPPALLLLVGDQPESSRAPYGPSWRAWGLLPVDCAAEELLAAVKALQQGLLVGDPSLMQPYLPSAVENTGPESVEALTEREAQVLQRLAQGLPNKQIAAALGISEHTVKFHVSAIYSKLGATNRTEAVRIGVRQGMIIM